MVELRQSAAQLPCGLCVEFYYWEERLVKPDTLMLPKDSLSGRVLLCRSSMTRTPSECFWRYVEFQNTRSLPEASWNVSM